MLDGKTIRPGDVVIGLASSGLHTNGYSLARKIFFEEMGMKPQTYVPELGNQIGSELLRVHVSYGPLIQAMLKKFNAGAGKGTGGKPVVKGMAHITGGGFVDNIPRVLPRNCDVVIRKGSWEIPPIFQLIQCRGSVPELELFQVFNMGIGMTVFVEASKAEALLRFIHARKQPAWIIGEVRRGQRRVSVE